MNRYLITSSKPIDLAAIFRIFMVPLFEDIKLKIDKYMKSRKRDKA